MNPTILTEGLSRKFGSTVAIDHVDLAVPQGAIYTLVGANGAGKTTMIKVLMNIFRPTSGSAQVLGKNSLLLPGKDFNQIGYVSENQEMLDWMTFGAMLEYFRPFYPTWDRDLERSLVRQFDLPLDRKLRHLSRGMRMKAAFGCRAPLRQPPFTYIQTTWSYGPCNQSCQNISGVQGAAWLGSLDVEPAGFSIVPLWASFVPFSNRFPSDDQRGYHPRHLCQGAPVTFTRYDLTRRAQTSLSIQSFQLPTLTTGQVRVIEHR